MSKFIPGRSKTGGRQPGTPNKRTDIVVEKAKQMGFDPFEALILFAKGDWEALGYESKQMTQILPGGGLTTEYTISPELRASCAGKACEYLYPKLKAVEHSSDGSVGNTFVSVTKADIKAAFMLDPMLRKEDCPQTRDVIDAEVKDEQKAQE